MNLYSLLESGFPADRLRVCLETSEGRSFSWRDLEDRVAQTAGFLHSLHLPEGARIAAQLEKSPESLVLYLATIRAGFVFLPLNTNTVHLTYFDGLPAVFFASSGHAICGWDSLTSFA